MIPNPPDYAKCSKTCNLPLLLPVGAEIYWAIKEWRAFGFANIYTLGSNLGTIEGAIFALFGLLMAFTFSGAASRFNERRMLIAEEANSIETAYLRLSL